MAPTEILSAQHYDNISNLLENTNMKVALLLGSTKLTVINSLFSVSSISGVTT